jgi:hypothetical protein
MTYFYKTYSTSQGDGGVSEETKKLWEHMANKKNWRVVQLPNGFFQSEHEWKGVWKDVTRRETLEGCIAAVEASVEYYQKRLEFAKGPKVVKTFD